jgi:hypothetical protein
MQIESWKPRTIEDRLLNRYVTDHPGLLFLEVEVGGRDPNHGPRRLDGLLICGRSVDVRPQDSYTREDVAASVNGAEVHVLEAKRHLNRNVVGQVEVGMALLKRDFSPASAVGVAVCAGGNIDLEWYCYERKLHVAIYDILPPEPTPQDGRCPIDVRRAPDMARKRAFMKGWQNAVAGRLYDSIRKRKTHANMGNMFGWIYGDKPAEFKDETWDRYTASL